MFVKPICFANQELLELTDTNQTGSNMDKNVCVQWIGGTYLETIAPNERLAIGRSEFLNAWKDLLPETWRNEPVLNKLPVSQCELNTQLSMFKTYNLTRRLHTNIPIHYQYVLSKSQRENR